MPAGHSPDQPRPRRSNSIRAPAGEYVCRPHAGNQLVARRSITVAAVPRTSGPTMAMVSSRLGTACEKTETEIPRYPSTSAAPAVSVARIPEPWKTKLYNDRSISEQRHSTCHHGSTTATSRSIRNFRSYYSCNGNAEVSGRAEIGGASIRRSSQ